MFDHLSGLIKDNKPSVIYGISPNFNIIRDYLYWKRKRAFIFLR